MRLEHEVHNFIKKEHDNMQNEKYINNTNRTYYIQIWTCTIS